MEKVISRLVCIVLFVPFVALAADGFQGNKTRQGGGGFTGVGPNTVTTVAEAKGMWDDSYVTLQGNITRHLGGERYTFVDQSGSITIEIDHDDWRGVSVGPEDLVRIYGEVDKDWHGTKIDVDSVQKMAKQ
jgi:Uncharacterized conserved protein